MSIENILKEYLTRYGIQDVQFNSTGMFSVVIDDLGLFSCEHIQDGIIIALFQDILPSYKADFMKRALQLVNPIENSFLYRPVLYQSQAGMIMAIQNEDISLSTLSTSIDALFRALQSTLRV